MPKAARKPRGSGRSRKPSPPTASADPGRVMTVRSRRPSFNRAGLRFSATIPTTVREDEVGADRFDRILAEPQLRCETA